jgi:hypothetical protein
VVRATAVLMFAAVLAVHGGCCLDILRQFRTHRFPTTTGTVTVSHVDTPPESWRATWRFEYAYAVGGVTYTGTRKNELVPERSVKSSVVEGYARNHPVGSTVRVFYDPLAPASARLEPGVTDGGPAIVWVLLLAQLLPLAAAAGLIDAARYGTGFDPADPRQVATAGGRTVARPQAHAARLLGLAAGAWFVATVVVVLLLGVHLRDFRGDPLGRDLFGLGVGVGFGAVVLGFQAAFLWRVLARPVLVLDAAAGRVAFFSRWRPRPTFDIPFAAVNWVQTVPVPVPLRDKPETRYQVQLGHAHPTPRVLAEFDDWRDADALAAWVWARVGAPPGRSG